MDDQEEILKCLYRNDPKTFKAVYDDLIYDMIELATKLLKNHVLGNEIVTRIWIKALENDFEDVKLPLRDYFLKQVELQCEINNLIY